MFGYAELDVFSKAKKGKQIFEIIKQNTAGLFSDQHGHFFAKIEVNDDHDGHEEQLSIDSPDFRYWVVNLYRKTQGDVVGKDTISSAIEALKGEIYESKQKFETHLRSWLDKESKSLHYDLVSSDWKSVEIAKEGWKVVDNTADHFIRYSHMLAQVEPVRDYDNDVLDRLAGSFNLKDASSKLLFKVYMVSLFIPDFPHPMLVVHGDHGSAKSSFMKMIKQMVDPSSVPLLKFPKDDRSAMLAFLQNYLVYFDNMTDVHKEQSDDLCRAVTGDGQFHRKLFEDETSKTYSYIRNIGMNGINNPAINPDLLDRVLSIELERIPSDKLLTEARLWSTINELKPKVLGYVFDTLAKALQIVDTVKIKRSHRLADFVEWGEAISRALGYADDLFVSKYAENAQLQVLSAIDSNIIASLMVKFVHSWSDSEKEFTAEGLLTELKAFAEESRIEYDSKHFPKTPNVLARRINIVKATLQDYGIRIEKYRKADSKSIKIIKVNTLLNPEYQAENAGNAPTTKIDNGHDSINIETSAAVMAAKTEESIEYNGIKVTFDGKSYHCNICKFSNIYLETMKHHIDNTDDDRHSNARKENQSEQKEGPT